MISASTSLKSDCWVGRCRITAVKNEWPQPCSCPSQQVKLSVTVAAVSALYRACRSLKNCNLEKKILRKPRIQVKITKQHLHKNFFYCIWLRQDATYFQVFNSATPADFVLLLWPNTTSYLFIFFKPRRQQIVLLSDPFLWTWCLQKNPKTRPKHSFVFKDTLNRF